MQKLAKSTHDLHSKIKEKKLMKLEKQSHNKKLEDGEVEVKMRVIMEKFKHAEENVQVLKVSYKELQLLFFT